MRDLSQLNRKFFRNLGGLTDHETSKLADYILMNTTGRQYPFPKVVIKHPAEPRPSCYTIKEWADRRKRKRAVVREFSKLHQEANLIVDDEINIPNWKAFKNEFSMTSASMSLIMRKLGYEWLSRKTQPSNKNMTLHDSGVNFLKRFMDLKKISILHGKSFFNRVSRNNKFLGFLDRVTNTVVRNVAERVTFGLLDFRNIPGAIIVGTPDEPYYNAFMKACEQNQSPMLKEIPIWLWICTDNNRVTVENIYKTRLATTYNIVSSAYHLGGAEHLKASAEMKKLKKGVSMSAFYHKKG